MRKSIIGVLLFFIISGMAWWAAAYYLPVEIYAIYATSHPLYEYDVIKKSNIRLFTRSTLGRACPVEDFTMNKKIAGKKTVVKLEDPETGYTTEKDLNSVPVIDSNIRCDKICYEDRMDEYSPNLTEDIVYQDGRHEVVNEQFLGITEDYQKDKNKIQYTVLGKNDTYQVEVPVIQVLSITTKDKVSIEKKLSANNLSLTIHYSNGTSQVAADHEVTSEVINHPEEGNHYLTCSYNGEKYKVKVYAYDPNPAPKITFENFGTFRLDLKKPYYVEDAYRINSYVGTVQFNNHRETFYTWKPYVGTSYYIPGEHFADDGTVRDEEGYICVAADYRYKSPHEIVLTSLGPGKVYDTGCAYGVIDIYCNWE